MTFAATKALRAILTTPAQQPRRGVFATVPQLLESGADVNDRDSTGYAPLHLLLRRDIRDLNRQEFDDTLALLLAAGADVDMALPDGRSCDVVAGFTDPTGKAGKMVAAERRRRADPYLRQHVRAIDPVWPLPGDLPDEAQRTAFLGSCQKGNLDHLHYMLHVHPSCVDWAYDGGNTGLITAVLAGLRRYETAQLLLARGADANRANDAGMTALMYACKLRESAECITLLIERGADETLKSNFDLTAAQYAKFDCADAGALPMLQNAIIRRNRQRETDAARRKASLAQSRKLKL